MNLILLAIINHTAHHLECECKGEGVIGTGGCYHGSRCDCNDGREAHCDCTYDGRTQGVVDCACCGDNSAEAVDEHGTAYCQRCGDEFEAAEAAGPGDVLPWWDKNPTPEAMSDLDRQATEEIDRFLARGPDGFMWEDEENDE